MNKPEKSDLITIGEIVRTHGIHGKLRIRYYNEDKNFFLSYRKILLMDSAGHVEAFEVVEARIHKDFILAQLKNVDGIGQAERFIGASVLVDKASLPALGEGEYYWTDLIGMEVKTVSGDRLGKVSDIIPTGGSDVFVVMEGKKEIFIPANEEVIKQIDTASRHIIVCLLEGLYGNDSI